MYLLRLRSGGLYVGCSMDLEQRLRDHQSGTACRTTKLDPPVGVEGIEEQPDFISARRRETQIKKWSRAKKEALIAGRTEDIRVLARLRD